MEDEKHQTFIMQNLSFIFDPSASDTEILGKSIKKPRQNTNLMQKSSFLRLLRIRTALAILMSAIAIQSHAASCDFESGSLSYNILSATDRTVEVFLDSNNSYPKSIEIPQTVVFNSQTYTVTSIKNDAFQTSDITSVTIPNSVTTIGEYAFLRCGSLSSVTIGNSVTTIGDRAFEECFSLPSVTIPNSVTTIGEYAFALCTGLSSITIPNSVTSIGEAAFTSCQGLLSVTISESVTSIENFMFNGCSSLSSVTIPNSVTSIGECAFSFCQNLSSITIPNSVTSIGLAAFSDCSSLSSITIPNSVTSIGQAAFFGCSSLSSFTIPNSVTSIGIRVFNDCENLEKIYVQHQTPLDCGSVFSDYILQNTVLYVPAGTLSAYKQADPWKNFRNIMEMDNSGIDEVAENFCEPIRVEDGRIVTDVESLTEVTDLQGHIVYHGYDRVIADLPQGIYIVRSGENIVKIKL